MSARGVGRGRGAQGGRGRGPRARGRGRGTSIWHYETYKPEPEAYENASWRLRRAPPAISHMLPDDCPIPNAQSRILNRRQTEDEYRANYYMVRITHDAPDGGVVTTVPVPLRGILQFVSRRELSRFENAESRAEAEAVAAAARAEAEEFARHNREANERAASRGRGSRMLKGLGATPLGHGRGRPRGRGCGRGRGLAARGGNHIQGNPVEQMTAGTSDGASDEDIADGSTLASLSPTLARSSYVTNSALSDSPIAAHSSLTRPSLRTHRVLDTDESRTDDDISSTSSGAAHLEPKADVRGRPSSLSDDSEPGRHRAKKRRTESSSVPRALFLPTSEPFSHGLGKSVTAGEPVNSPDEASLDEHDTIDVQHPIVAISANGQSHRHQPAYANALVGESEEEAELDNDDAVEYVVERILDHSYEQGQKYYLVKWEGYEDSSDWVSADDLAGAAELVAEYEQAVLRRKGKDRLAMR